MEEQRADPADGLLYTFAEISDFYAHEYSPAEVQSYWSSMFVRSVAEPAARATKTPAGGDVGKWPEGVAAPAKALVGQAVARSQKKLPPVVAVPAQPGRGAAHAAAKASQAACLDGSKPAAVAPAVEVPRGHVVNSSWAKYPSINDVDLEQVEKVRRAVQGTSFEFVAVEKVHGSNFAFETDGRKISYFSRNRRLEPEERFVGKTSPAEAMQPYHGPVMEAFRHCNAAASNGTTSLIVYGEYFGGWYPHHEVKQVGPGAGAPVQKGVVAYAPAHHFFAFDVCVDGAYLDFDEAQGVLTRAGFPLVATPVLRGSFEECMAFNVETFCTTLPQLLGLPLCEDYAIAEGVVILPVRRREAWAVKKKSVRYLEACPAELRKWMNKCVESTKEAFAGLYECLCQRPRLDAVLSKEPQLRGAAVVELPRIQRLYRQDVEEAFQEKLLAIGMAVPTGGLEAVRAEADRRVAEWMLGLTARAA